MQIRGTGIREAHCWIENDGEGVIVYPNGVDVAIQVDGVNVTEPSRLSQGEYWTLQNVKIRRKNLDHFLVLSLSPLFFSLLPTLFLSNIAY